MEDDSNNSMIPLVNHNSDMEDDSDNPMIPLLNLVLKTRELMQQMNLLSDIEDDSANINSMISLGIIKKNVQCFLCIFIVSVVGYNVSGNRRFLYHM